MLPYPFRFSTNGIRLREEKEALDIIKEAKRVLKIESQSILDLKERIGEEFLKGGPGAPSM